MRDVGRQTTSIYTESKMKMFSIVAAAIVQPFAMYFFLRVLQCGFFVSGGLAALVAMLAGFGVHFVQAHMARNKSS